MTAPFLLLALSIAFPKAGQRLPPIDRCYLIGATAGGETNLVIQGRDVPVYRTGGWVTVVDCREGTNVVSVAGSNHWFVVARRPPPKVGVSTGAPPAKVWKKLACAADEPRPHPSVAASEKPLTIVLDPGHGGADAGAVSPHGIPEKDANLRMALAVRRALERRGFVVWMTREDDRAVPLYERPLVAHTNDVAAFVSIHHNAPPADRDPRDFRYHAVYCWNDLGERLSLAINARMAEAFGQTLRNNGVPRANFAVTRSPEVPSCLVEVDFLTTPEGEEACWDPVRRLKIADAIAAGIADWCR